MLIESIDIACKHLPGYKFATTKIKYPISLRTKHFFTPKERMSIGVAKMMKISENTYATARAMVPFIEQRKDFADSLH